ncbi:hypothetical protein HPP92_028961 [Vanilla planifolia]|uniref:Uncharacterized protein n=1 Tax=Vanilla planifolia TaxID=51239 RepID=A0A835U2R0_VANPL|nr:hypothetical protein HPP92_028961 [Vanilla planifolia]KAG0446197.1 hypothetical protein HPP92_028950 [Vanilla planifolia]
MWDDFDLETSFGPSFSLGKYSITPSALVWVKSLLSGPFSFNNPQQPLKIKCYDKEPSRGYA